MAVQIHDNQLQIADLLGEVGEVCRSEFSLSGSAVSYVEALERDTNVVVTITDPETGHVIVTSQGWVKGVNVVRDKIAGKWGTTLKHQIKLGEQAPEPE